MQCERWGPVQLQHAHAGCTGARVVCGHHARVLGERCGGMDDEPTGHVFDHRLQHGEHGQPSLDHGKAGEQGLRAVGRVLPVATCGKLAARPCARVADRDVRERLRVFAREVVHEHRVFHRVLTARCPLEQVQDACLSGRVEPPFDVLRQIALRARRERQSEGRGGELRRWWYLWSPSRGERVYAGAWGRTS